MVEMELHPRVVRGLMGIFFRILCGSPQAYLCYLNQKKCVYKKMAHMNPIIYTIKRKLLLKDEFQ